MLIHARRLAGFSALAVLLFSGLAVAQSTGGIAPLSPYPSILTLLQTTQTFGMVGLAAGQTARLNLLNPGSLLLTGAAANSPAAACFAQLTFLDSTGKTLKTASVSALSGQSAPFDLNRDLDLTTTAQRVEIRATVQAMPNPTAGATAVPFFCSLIPTLEVFDNSTGKTTVVLESLHYVAGPLSFLTPGIN
jgi:hypothetical protein